jgi:hypothetical protein
LPKFDFGHRTAKPEMFGHSLLKPFIFGHPMVLVGGFADVDATWQWDPPVNIFSLSSLFLLSPLFSTDSRRPSP